MFLRKISIQNFRNYSNQSIEFNERVTVFTGRNAQGKTNLLEAIYFLSTGRSFRTSRVQEMILHGAEYLQVNGVVERMGSISRIKVYYSGGEKSVHINARKTRKLYELVGILNAVVFAPDDMEIIKGAPSGRRRFLDIQIAQVQNSYLKNLHDYGETLRQRNAALKKGDRETIEVYTEELARHGARVICERRETLRKLALLARLAYRKLTGSEEMTLAYITSSRASDEEEVGESLKSELKRKLERDIATGITNAGPHRDDISIRINGMDARSYASEGQKRSVAIALKLAQYELIKSAVREEPVLLIDDITSELDPMRKRALMPILEERGQIFLATASDSGAPKEWLSAKVLTIEKGTVI